jgi:cysteine-S-conjugate beta-lyase
MEQESEMPFDFDQIIDRRGTGSRKWAAYPEDVIPMWIADMDFRAPQPVIDALVARAGHGIFGYENPSPELASTICERLARLYAWTVQPEEVVVLPGVVSALNVACRAIGSPGSGVLMQTPVYPPFLHTPQNNGGCVQTAPFGLAVSHGILRYETDYELFESAITPLTRLFALCHPHNPTGAARQQDELSRLAEICLRHDVVICSDEIHCDLMLGGAKHIPMASISPDVAARCITLMAPSKTFNVPGLGCSFAVIQDSDLRHRFCQAADGLVPYVSLLGTTAALAAYQHGDEWLAALVGYLTANRDYLVDYVRRNLSGVAITIPDATYLAWLDCRQAGIPGNPHQFFLEKGRVALNDGAAFGDEGEGFVRLNFGCPRSTLTVGLERMRAALADAAPSNRLD